MRFFQTGPAHSVSASTSTSFTSPSTTRNLSSKQSSSGSVNSSQSTGQSISRFQETPEEQDEREEDEEEEQLLDEPQKSNSQADEGHDYLHSGSSRTRPPQVPLPMPKRRRIPGDAEKLTGAWNYSILLKAAEQETQSSRHKHRSGAPTRKSTR